MCNTRVLRSPYGVLHTLLAAPSHSPPLYHKGTTNTAGLTWDTQFPLLVAVPHRLITEYGVLYCGHTIYSILRAHLHCS